MNLLVLPWKTNKNTFASVTVKQKDTDRNYVIKLVLGFLLFEKRELKYMKNVYGPINCKTNIWFKVLDLKLRCVEFVVLSTRL